MTDKTLASLPAVSTLTGTELAYMEQGGTSSKATAAQVLAYIEANASAILNVVGSTQGQLLYRDASAWAVLAPGLAGQVLGAQGAAANPTWMDFVHPGYISGNWYYAQVDASVIAGTAIGANVIQFGALMVFRPITVAQLGCRVTTAQASQNFQLALYAADPTTKLPTGLPLASTPDMSTASAAVVTSTLSGANVLLLSGLYWVAINTNGSTAAFQALSSAGAHDTALVGNSSAAALSNSSTMAFIKRTFAQTYGTWPDMTSNTITSVAGTITSPALMWKAA